MPNAYYDDPVVAEIHAIRAKLLAECGGDARQYLEQTRQRQAASGRQVISAPPRPAAAVLASVEPIPGAILLDAPATGS